MYDTANNCVHQNERKYHWHRMLTPMQCSLPARMCACVFMSVCVCVCERTAQGLDFTRKKQSSRLIFVCVKQVVGIAAQG